MERSTKAVVICAIVAGVGVVAAIGISIWYVSGYMPGTFYRDENGVPHGTGWQRYWYESGGLKLEEYFVAGKPEKSRWLRPDGSLVAETDWDNGSGIGYYLREDGSIRARIEYVKGVAHGKGVYYNEDGSVNREVEFVSGKEVTNRTLPTATSPDS